MGYVFLFFSVDEISRIHEGITSISNEFGIRSFFPGAHGMWVILYPTILLLLVLLFWKGFFAFLKEKDARSVFLVGAVVFFVGGIGFEVFGYYLDKSTKSLLYVVEVTAEESFEKLGQSLMIYALLSKIYFMRENAS